MTLIKALFGAAFLFFSTTLFAADNHHVYPNDQVSSADLKEKKLEWPGYCEIEIINDSYTDVRVYGIYDDGVILQPFSVYRYEYPHYISLYYYGYCHTGMDIHVYTLGGYQIYAGYTQVNSILHLVPYMMLGQQQTMAKICNKGKTC